MPTIRIKDNGPYQVSGTFKIIDAKGNNLKLKEKSLYVDVDARKISRFVTALIKRFILKVNHEQTKNL